MGLRDDLERYREVGEERRQDLAEFIQYGDLGGSRPDSVRIPVKIVDLPGFEYDRRDAGGPRLGEPHVCSAGVQSCNRGIEATETGFEHGCRRISRPRGRIVPGALERI